MTTKPYSLEELREMREGIVGEEWWIMPGHRCADYYLISNDGDGITEKEHQANADAMQATPALLDQLIETMEADRWIPVSEGLPEPNKIVLTYSEEYGVVPAKLFEGISFSAEYADYETGEPWLHGKDTVTHWKPLPLPPAPEGE